MGIVSKIQWSVEHRGLVGTLKAAARSAARRLSRAAAAAPHPFDWEHHTDTGGYIAGHDLGEGHDHDRFITGYAPIPPSSFRAALMMWASSGLAYPVSDYTFIDAGCGKGRALLLASQFGFREVVGVEINRGLVEVAKRNVAIWNASGNAGCSITVACTDVLDFTFPPGPVLVYLYNPFAEPVVRALAQRLKNSYANDPAGVEVIYHKPEHSEAFEHEFKLTWSKALGMLEEERASDSASSAGDESRAYRL